ncbi:MAG: hypothetical protein H6737_00885 [Alphaproteobacteria bacterium]|nr:hypothetical protein [Alphaproteobacteria bacterium]
MIPIAAEVTGRIEGGWEFVFAAYAITWATFGLYTLSLWARARREES